MQFGEFALVPLSTYIWQVYWKCSLWALHSHRGDTPPIWYNILFKSIGEWAVLVSMTINTTWAINLSCRSLVLIAQIARSRSAIKPGSGRSVVLHVPFCRLSLSVKRLPWVKISFCPLPKYSYGASTTHLSNSYHHSPATALLLIYICFTRHNGCQSTWNICHVLQ